MKKSFFAIALMASLLAGAADTGTDSYLYWMVNVNEGGWKYDYSVQVKGVTKNPAGSSLLNLYYADSSSADPVQSIGKTVIGYYKGTGTGLYAQLLSNKDYTSFVFEIVCDTRIITSETVTYTDVQACIAGGGIGTPAQNLLAVSMALPAPEPSSGLLLLLGVAGLALRRRKQITA